MISKLMNEAKLADHFQVSQPELRRALVETELFDEYLVAPTAEGHLLAGAELVQKRGREYAFEYRWCPRKLASIIPCLGARAEKVKYTQFRNRWRAAAAMRNSGHLLAEHLRAPDADVYFLMSRHNSILAAHSPRLLRKYGEDILKPLVGRLKRRLADQGVSGLPRAVEAMKWLDGLIQWTTGTNTSPACPPLNFNPVQVVPEEIDRKATAGRFAITDQEDTLLRSGYAFVTTFAESPTECFLENVLREMRNWPSEGPPKGLHARLLRRGRHDYLLLACTVDDLLHLSVREVSLKSGWLNFLEQQDLADFKPEIVALLRRGGSHVKRSIVARKLDRLEQELERQIAEGDLDDHALSLIQDRLPGKYKR